MEYQFKLSDIAGIYSPGAAQVQALLAVAERLERLVEVIEQKLREPQEALDTEEKAKEFLESFT